MTDRKVYLQARHLAWEMYDIGVFDIQHRLRVGYKQAESALLWLAQTGVVTQPQSNGRCRVLPSSK